MTEEEIKEINTSYNEVHGTVSNKTMEELCDLAIKGLRARELEDALELCLHLLSYSETSQDEEWEANREICINALKAYRKDGVG